MRFTASVDQSIRRELKEWRKKAPTAMVEAERQ
jgi:hypothetical protein